MPTDPPPSPPVTARAVLAALSTIRRKGQWPLLQALERQEPDLAEQVLESLSLVHQTLLRTGAPPRVVRRLQRQVQQLVLLSWLCLRPAAADEA